MQLFHRFERVLANERKIRRLLTGCIGNKEFLRFADSNITVRLHLVHPFKSMPVTHPALFSSKSFKKSSSTMLK
jgi:hypothetical protein